MQTIAHKIIKDMQSNGHTLLGQIGGQYTFRKGSNLSNYLLRIGKTLDQVIVKTGARRQHRTEGWQLLIFSK